MPMYEDSITKFAHLAAEKRDRLLQAPLAFLIGSALAGAYIGFAVVLVLTLGAAVPPEARALVMGAGFAVGLILCTFAGSELFTGQAMYMSFGLLRGTTTAGDLAQVWATTWLGNLLGSVVVAGLFATAGGGGLLSGGSDFLFDLASHKMHAPTAALVARGILCNWLVCAALWTASRMQGDAAKCIAIFFCVFAFVASGFDHSVANMTTLSLALMGNHPEAVTPGGMVHNLAWVTLGNAVGGAVFVAGAYWAMSRAAPAPLPLVKPERS